MNTTVMASFSNIDSAAQAASDIRSRCGQIKSLKIKSRSIKTDNSNISLWGAGAAYANQSGFPYMQSSGLLPTPMAFPIPTQSKHSEYDNVRPATLEVVVDSSTDIHTICATIRQDGGVSLKTGQSRQF